MPLWKDKNSQEKKECKDRRRNFLLSVADKPLKTQIVQYFKVINWDFWAIHKEFETYKVENSKLSQYLQYKKYDAEIREKINNNYSYEYSIDITKNDNQIYDFHNSNILNIVCCYCSIFY